MSQTARSYLYWSVPDGQAAEEPGRQTGVSRRVSLKQGSKESEQVGHLAADGGNGASLPPPLSRTGSCWQQACRWKGSDPGAAVDCKTAALQDQLDSGACLFVDK